MFVPLSTILLMTKRSFTIQLSNAVTTLLPHASTQSMAPDRFISIMLHNGCKATLCVQQYYYSLFVTWFHVHTKKQETRQDIQKNTTRIRQQEEETSKKGNVSAAFRRSLTSGCGGGGGSGRPAPTDRHGLRGQ